MLNTKLENQMQANNKGSKLYEFGPEVKRIIVVGDLHGDLPSYDNAVKVWREEPGSHIVFLGDYADRGSYGVEIIESLIQLAREPNVVVLKGNHEDYPSSGRPWWGPFDLKDEVEYKRGPWKAYYEQTLKPFVAGLYLAAVVPGKLLFVHGGISKRVTSMDSLRYLLTKVEEDVLWSDPSETAGQADNSRGRGVEFGADVTKTVTNKLEVGMIFRSHQPGLAKTGPFFSHDGRVVTISSSRRYGIPHCIEVLVNDPQQTNGDISGLKYNVRYLATAACRRSTKPQYTHKVSTLGISV